MLFLLRFSAAAFNSASVGAGGVSPGASAMTLLPCSSAN